MPWRPTAGGYRLTADVDAHVFCRSCAAPAIASTADPRRRLPALERALALWRGPAFDEFAHEQWAAGEATRLDELHAAATEDHAEALARGAPVRPTRSPSCPTTSPATRCATGRVAC